MLLEYLAKEGGIALLEVNPGLVLWTFIIFGVVLFLLHRFVWKVIAQALDTRARKVHDDIASAQKLKEEAEEKLGAYLEKIGGAQEEAQAILAQGQKDAQIKRDEILALAKQEMQSLTERSQQEIIRAKEAAVRDIQNQLVALATQIAAQVLQGHLQAEDHKKLHAHALKQLEKIQSRG